MPGTKFDTHRPGIFLNKISETSVKKSANVPVFQMDFAEKDRDSKVSVKPSTTSTVSNKSDLDEKRKLLWRRRSSFGIATSGLDRKSTTSMKADFGDIAMKIAHRRKSVTQDLHNAASGSMLNILGMLKNDIEQRPSAVTLLEENEDEEQDDIDEKDFLDAEWDTIVQRHIDFRIAGEIKNETVWPRDTLFKYLEIMERLVENIHERQEICNLVTLSLLNIHDTA